MIACIAAGFGCLFAHDTRTVKGVVISSEDNLPVIGAAVMEKGTKNATMTDLFSSPYPFKKKSLLIISG